MLKTTLAASSSATETQLDSRLIRFVAKHESIRLDYCFGGMVRSTVIRGAWYLPERRQLDLVFTSGRRYVYSNVPMAIAHGFAEAESKGRFYNREIRNRYPCREVGRNVGREAVRRAA